MKIFLVAIGMMTVVGLAGCGGEAGLGEECGAEGAEGECVEGGVCGKPGDDSEVAQCLRVCTEQADCADTEECNGVSGTSVKGCRPKAK